MALPVGFYGSLQWIGWLSLLDEVALNHWNTHIRNSMQQDEICAIKSLQYETIRANIEEERRNIA